MELEPGPQPKGGAFGVLGHRKALGQRRMVVTHLAEVFDQRVVQRHDEIVRTGGTVVLLRVEPARGNIGVPRQYHLAFGNDCRGRGRCAQTASRARSSPAPPSSARCAVSGSSHSSSSPRRLTSCFLRRPVLLFEEPCAKCSAAMQDCLGYFLDRERRAARGRSSRTRCKSTSRGICRIFLVNGGSRLSRDQRPDRVCCHE